jgi:hypothetical protein
METVIIQSRKIGAKIKSQKSKSKYLSDLLFIDFIYFLYFALLSLQNKTPDKIFKKNQQLFIEIVVGFFLCYNFLIINKRKND